MPTQEERVTALEKFQKEAASHIRETEENTTILLGVIREQGRDIKRTVQRLDTIDDQLNTINDRLDTIDGRLNTLEQRMESRFETLDKKFDQALQLLTALTTRMNQ